jgi:hypothetical protein
MKKMKPSQLIEILSYLKDDKDILVFNGVFWDKATGVDVQKFSNHDGEYYEDDDGEYYYALSGDSVE